MARIKIELPEVYCFETELTVRISDVNYGNHLGNDAVLSLVHEARVRCLKDKGLNELDCGGAGLIMRDAVIIYSRQGFHGDRINIKMGIAAVKNFSFEFLHLLACQGKELARVQTGMAFFNYTTQTPAPVPEVFRKAFSLSHSS